MAPSGRRAHPPFAGGIVRGPTHAKQALLAEALAQQQGGLSSTIQRVLAKSDGTDRLLLVVDQFEELFTLATPEEHAPFVRALVDGVNSVPVTVFINIRADFFSRALESDRDLSDAFGKGIVPLGPMRPEELQRVIEEPARRVGLQFKAGLVDSILTDVPAEPGNLPLLEYALTELWSRRSGSRADT